MVLVLCMCRFLRRNPKEKRGEWKGSRTSSYSKPPNKYLNPYHHRIKKSRSSFSKIPNPAPEGKPSTRCPHDKISAQCFLKEEWRQMSVFPLGSFLVLSSKRNTQQAWTHWLVYQKEKYLIMSVSGKTASRGMRLHWEVDLDDP